MLRSPGTGQGTRRFGPAALLVVALLLLNRAAAQPPEAPPLPETMPTPTAPGVPGEFATGAAPQAAPGAPAQKSEAKAVPCPDPKSDKKEEKQDDKKVNWAKVPPITKGGAAGWFRVRSTGPGYYSLLDCVQGNYLEAAPKMPRGQRSLNSNPTFNYDYRYLEDPNNTQHEWSDFYKRVHFGPNGDWLFSGGGEIKNRYMNELGGNRGLGQNNFYNLFRVRSYGDLWYKDQFRVFVEFMDTQSLDTRFPPTGADESGPDLQNAFVEAKVGDPFGGPLSVRVGRQELIYGSQRLISPPDWANARRTFQGAKLYWVTEQWSIDAFWVQPVVNNPNKFDSVNNNQNLFGIWSTYRPKAGTFLDLYYVGFAQGNTTTNNGDLHTMGSRYTGDVEQHFLYDFEGAVQFGERGTRHDLGRFMSSGVGWLFAEVPWVPHVWVYYDYVSGDKDPTGRSGSNRGFRQLFAQNHNYFGYIDLVGRQNIHDLNVHVTARPQPWIGLYMAYHTFNLDSARDALYNSGGNVIRRDPTGRSGNSVGQEIDLLVDIRVTSHQDLMVGYSKFFAGTFYKLTGNPNNIELFYAQYSMKW